MPTYQVIYIVVAGLNGFLMGIWGVERGKGGELRCNFENLGTKFFEVDLILKSVKLPDLCRQDLVFDFSLYIIVNCFFWDTRGSY
jgi:hypothetical protein